MEHLLPRQRLGLFPRQPTVEFQDCGAFDEVLVCVGPELIWSSLI